MPRKSNYWTKQRVLKMMRRAVREIFESNPDKLTTNNSTWTKLIQPFNVEHHPHRPLYPSVDAISRTCGGLRLAWKALGYNVTSRQPPSRRRRIYTPEIDDRIREIYSRPIPLGKNFQGGIGVKALAQELGWPPHAITQRARDLGIGRVKEKPWTQEEIAALDELAHYTPPTIERKFRELGFSRTEQSIAVMRKRREAHKGGKYFSGHALQMLMGMGDHVVDRKWIKMGLKFILKGTRRHGGQNADTRLFHIDEIRRFFIEHPEEIDLLKVDKWFFLEMITAGKIKMIAPSTRLSVRAECPRPGLKRGDRQEVKTKAKAA
jgi:hypothetical protein